jgi:hypothetical protein
MTGMAGMTGIEIMTEMETMTGIKDMRTDTREFPDGHWVRNSASLNISDCPLDQHLPLSLIILLIR